VRYDDMPLALSRAGGTSTRMRDERGLDVGLTRCRRYVRKCIATVSPCMPSYDGLVRVVKLALATSLSGA
jgi:hypothetical protein